MYSLKTFLSEIRKIKDSGNLISFMSDGKINDALSEESIIDVSSIEVKVFVDGKEHTITYKWEVNIISLSELLETIKNKLLNRQVKEFLNEDLTNINNELLLLKKKYISFFSQDKLADSYKYIVNITTEDKESYCDWIKS